MQTLLQDLRYAARLLRKSPAFTAVALLTLALGIGANTAMFSATHAVLLRRLPFPHPEQLVMIWEKDPRRGFFGDRYVVGLRTLLRWKQDARSFQDIAAFQIDAANLAGADYAERVDAAKASSNIFPVLGVQTELGRTFAADEGLPGHNRVVIISHELWNRRFAAAKTVLGRTITLDAVPYTIIGVLQRSFYLPSIFGGYNDTKPDVWTPANISLAQTKEALDEGDVFYVLGRLRPGVSLAQAHSEIEVIEARLRREDPERYGRVTTTMFPLDSHDNGAEIRRSLLVLQFTVAFVLLIACANLANLLLTRAALREKEMAIRAALGASRGRLVRQMLSESLLFSVTGGLAGLLLAWWGIRTLDAIAPSGFARIGGLGHLTISLPVLAFTAAIVVIAAFLFGLAPAIHAAGSVRERMNQGGRTGHATLWQISRSMLVIAEVALAVVPFAGASLMIRTLHALTRIDPGFVQEHLLTAHLALPRQNYNPPERQRAFADQLLESVRAIPSVHSATTSGGLPMETSIISSFHLEGGTFASANSSTLLEWIREDYFRTMGIPLLRGQAPTQFDAEQNAPVAVVNSAFAKYAWYDRDPIGAALFLDQGGNGKGKRYTVIGIAGDVHQLGLPVPAKPQIYIPTATGQPMTLIVRTSGDPKTLMPAVMDALQRIDPTVPLYNVKPMTEVLADTLSQQRFTTSLLIAFAALGLALAGIGLYGVVSYIVSQRTQEFGIRLALGANARQLRAMVVRQALAPVAVGLVVGVAAALGLTRAMSSLLYGVSALDAITYASVLVVITAVALVASYVPARRATKVDPMVALRCE